MKAPFKPAPVQLTNSSSIKSKAAMEAAGYVSGFNYSLFLAQGAASPSRSALINRGYFIRVHCLLEQIKAFSRLHADFQVISLGCGWDTTWMKMQRNPNCSLWIDTDFEALLKVKAQVFDQSSVVLPAFYRMLAVDLTDLGALAKQLDFVCKEKPTLFLAECSLTYLPVEKSDDLLAFLSGSFKKATLLIYEQIHGESPSVAGEDPFAKTMCEHFTSLSTPIHSLHAYPTLADQLTGRFAKAGFTRPLTAFTLEHYWNNVIALAEKERINSLEVFDEWEDWHVKLAHYFVALVSNYSGDDALSLEECKLNFSEDDDSGRHSDSTFKVQLIPIENAPKGWGHAAAVCASGKIVSLGGFHHRRVEGMQVFGLSTLEGGNSANLTAELDCPVPNSNCPQGRMFTGGLVHWRDDSLLLFGGRKSPSLPLGELWKLSIPENTWELMHTDGPSRFRHCTWVYRDKLYVFGGIGTSERENSCGKCTTLGDLWVLDLIFGDGKRWTKVPFSFPTSHLQRHSASSCLVQFQGKPHALISGGLSANEQALDDILLIPLIDGSFVPRGDFSIVPIRISGIPNLRARYSHSCTMLEGGLLALIGGVIGGVGLSKEHFIQLVNVNDFSQGAQSVALEAECCVTGVNSQLCVDYCGGRMFLMGGGLNCFSMGSLYDGGFEVVITRVIRESKGKLQEESHCLLLTGSPSLEAQPDQAFHTPNLEAPALSQLRLRPSPALSDPSWRVTVHSGPLTPEVWNQLYAKREPILFRNVPFMKQDWTPEFLNTAVPPETLISFHNSSTPILDFTTRNFDFKVLPFSQLLTNLYNAQYTSEHFFYLRSIGENPRKEQADIFQSFPGLAASIDFPWTAVPQMREAYFSSVLRITSPAVELWTHYDVMDNILFQVKGSKTITLWHPRDYPHLSMEGSSSRVIDIEHTQCPAFFHSTPTRFELREGEFLFIPSLVFHHTRCAIGVPSFAVNSFWRHLPVECYGKRDLYGNKDLQAAASALELQAKALESVRGLPAWYRDFYLAKIREQLEV